MLSQLLNGKILHYTIQNESILYLTTDLLGIQCLN